MVHSIIRKLVMVDCPKLKTKRQILVYIKELSQLGTTTPGYKKDDYECADKSNCEYLDQYGRCECYTKLPHNPHLM